MKKTGNPDYDGDFCSNENVDGFRNKDDTFLSARDHPTIKGPIAAEDARMVWRLVRQRWQSEFGQLEIGG
jgi:hypothetical protein